MAKHRKANRRAAARQTNEVPSARESAELSATLPRQPAEVQIRKPRTKFNFLDLPTDIRCVFYENLFHGIELECSPVSAKLLKQAKAIPSKSASNRKKEDSKPFLVKIYGPGHHVFSLLLTCKLIYGEARLALARATMLSLGALSYKGESSLAPSLGCSLSAFTLENIRYIDGLPLVVYDFQKMGPMDLDPQMEPNPDFGGVMQMLPNLRVCVAAPIRLDEETMHQSLVKKIRSEGPAIFFRHHFDKSPQDFLRACGVDNASIARVEIIQPLHVVPQMPAPWMRCCLINIDVGKYWDTMINATETMEAAYREFLALQRTNGMRAVLSAKDFNAWETWIDEKGGRLWKITGKLPRERSLQ